MAWRELPTRNLAQLVQTLRLSALGVGDITWAIGALFTISLASVLILALAHRLDPNFHPSPEFLRQPPGWHAWVFAAWIPLFISNVVGEELCWRGYVLPRQEAALGSVAWLLNGTMWCLFHWSFGWPVMLLLLPIALLLPWIVPRSAEHVGRDVPFTRCSTLLGSWPPSAVEPGKWKAQGCKVSMIPRGSGS
jgi:membrane protease YdiL (CAAX protease family)